MKEPKMVIVVRTLYPDKDNQKRKIRTGKLMSQAAHAGSAWLCNLIKDMIKTGISPQLSEFEKKWILERFKKVCVYVDCEKELEDIYEKALNAKLNVVKIVDSGLTEFSGEPTFTCVGIGPNDPDEIDKITGALPLL